MGVGALSVGRGTVTPVSSPPSTTSTGSVRLRLNPTNAQAAVLVRAAGPRRFAFNWDPAQIKANQDQRAGEATYDIPRMDRTQPFSYFDLVRRWDAVKHAAVPWHVEQSVWTSIWLFILARCVGRGAFRRCHINRPLASPQAQRLGDRGTRESDLQGPKPFT